MIPTTFEYARATSLDDALAKLKAANGGGKFIAGLKKAEIQLDRKASDKRVYPAIDIQKSGTRKDELLLDKGTLAKTHVLRRILSPMGTIDAIEFLLDKLRTSKNNSDFFDSMNT